MKYGRLLAVVVGLLFATLAGNFADENDFDYRLVDEVGFIDLTPGSGHGFGGYSALGFVEVYGKAMARK